MYIEYKIIPIFYIVRTYDSRGEENATSSSDTSVATSTEDTPVYYHVIFQNYDGTKLYEVDVLEGEAAHYVGETPRRDTDDEYVYTFLNWDKDLSSVTSDIITKATYDVEINGDGWSPIIWF